MSFYNIINKFIDNVSCKQSNMSYKKTNVSCKQIDQSTLDNRMRKYIKNDNKQCHGFKPFVITIKSKTLSRYINDATHADFNEKIKLLNAIQDILFETSKMLYEKYNPNLIYTFQNEINVVFFYNDNGTFIYDGNINKILTSIVSVVSVEVYKRLSLINVEFDLDFQGQFIEFDIDYEVLNYLVWRQMDCKRNTITLLYRCYDNKNIENIKVNDMIDFLNIQTKKDISKDHINLLTGNIVKKYLFYKIQNQNNDNIISRRSIGIENFYFSDNFSEKFRKYIVNKII
jgi:hypothetical protein